MKKTKLIDGSSLLSTSFYGNLPFDYKKAKTDEERERAKSKILQTKDGQYTNGVFTMMTTLLSLIKKEKPDYLAVAWDLDRNTFRRDLYPEYKITRKEKPAELKSQFALAQEVLKEMNIAQFIVPKYEADDILGTLSRKFQQETSVTILTKDQDALQLVNERVRLWYMTKKAEEMYQEIGMSGKHMALPVEIFEFTPEYVRHFYGVEPIQIIERKALEGDTSDNIPGVKGVGEASSVPLIQEFGTVEEVFDYVENTPEKEAKAFIKDLGVKRSPLSYLLKTSDTGMTAKESALLSKQLATIQCDMTELQHVTLQDITLQINEVGQRRVFERLQFSSLLEEVDKKEQQSA